MTHAGQKESLLLAHLVRQDGAGVGFSGGKFMGQVMEEADKGAGSSTITRLTIHTGVKVGLVINLTQPQSALKF